MDKMGEEYNKHVEVDESIKHFVRTFKGKAQLGGYVVRETYSERGNVIKRWICVCVCVCVGEVAMTRCDELSTKLRIPEKSWKFLE